MLSSQNNSLSKVTTPLGGDRRRIETTGTLKILIIFAQFYNETSLWDWTHDQLPEFKYTIIDSVVRPIYTNYPPFSVSSFFKEMSNGKFNVIGKFYPKVITTNHPQSYYKNLYPNNNIYKNGLVNLEVLQKVDSLGRLYNNINFKEFDNWKRVQNPNAFPDGQSYTVSSGPDEVIDMVVIIYKDIDQTLFPVTVNANLADPTTSIYTRLKS